MQVVKRNGKHEDVSFDKVLNRIQLAAQGLEVNPTLIESMMVSKPRSSMNLPRSFPFRS
jgi:transcriptional regulator NrdR family protein